MRALDFLSPRFRECPWSFYSAFRRSRPVWWSEAIGMLCVFKQEHVRHVLTAPEYTVEYPFRVSEQVFGRTLLDMDGPEHRRLRSVVSTLFSRENVQRVMEEIVEPLVAEVIGSLRGRESIDFMTDVAEVVPARVMCRFLEIPSQEAEATIEDLNCALNHLDGSRGDFERASSARRALESRLARALEVAEPAGRYQSVASLKGELSPTEGLRVMMLLLAAGVETSVCALGNTLFALLEHPAWMEEVRRDEAAIERVVAEAFRWEPPQHDTVRFARTEHDLGGVRVFAGQPIKVMLASANRDESVWPDAGEFVPGRQQQTAMSFGFGPHMCLGRTLALLEIAHVMRVLVRETTLLEWAEGAEARPAGNTFRRPSALRIRARWRGLEE